MKKYIAVLVSFLMAVILSGCACEHQWTEADCLNPQVCSKCEETSGEALGHDWMSASCIAPETCSRCLETKGNALGHTYGDWKFHKDVMTHSCEICKSEETLPLDRELYLEPLLSGNWFFRCLIQDGQYHYANKFDSIGFYVNFYEDRKTVFYDFEQEHTGVWKFIEYKEEDGDDCYYFSLEYDGTENGPFLLVDHADEDDQLYIFFSGNAQVILSQCIDTHKALLGTWKYSSGDTHWTITFTEDHRVHGTIGDSFTGTWYPLVEYTRQFENNCTIVIDLDVNSEIIQHRVNLYMGKPGLPSENNTANHSPRLEWKVGFQPVNFTKKIESYFRE